MSKVKLREVALFVQHIRTKVQEQQLELLSTLPWCSFLPDLPVILLVQGLPLQGPMPTFCGIIRVTHIGPI